MVAHVGCGTWTKGLSGMLDTSTKTSDGWTRCFVDSCCSVHEALFCIPETQRWDSLPLSALFNATTDADSVGDLEIVLLPQCCGSLCKYLMVASRKASVFILQARSQTIIKAWDHAVGVICVHEAGGKVSDWKGIQLDFAAELDERRIILPSAGILVSDGNVHIRILEMISSTSSIV